ncbi:hypothetical protein T492DRAFT_1110292 [Pavlovales sp. CCMP2436]|nr:hypothetical protein T492DRAFT_1110292 [Pavlovales sp. CCMP2436]
MVNITGLSSHAAVAWLKLGRARTQVHCAHAKPVERARAEVETKGRCPRLGLAQLFGDRAGRCHQHHRTGHAVVGREQKGTPGAPARGPALQDRGSVQRKGNEAGVTLEWADGQVLAGPQPVETARVQGRAEPAGGERNCGDGDTRGHERGQDGVAHRGWRWLVALRVSR